MWFTFNQNNSGGSFVFDEDSGITHYVIIEARDYKDANHRAEDIGIYFDGCSNNMDCSCCGDRWYPAWDGYKGSEFPAIYDKNIREDNGYRSKYPGWMKENMEIAIHPIDGSIEWYGIIRE